MAHLMREAGKSGGRLTEVGGGPSRAAITGGSGRLRYNFGDTPFAHAPPTADFEAFCSVVAP